jgi:hypothetical protein
MLPLVFAAGAQRWRDRIRSVAMHDADWTDEDILTYEVSDEALEAASGSQFGGVTLMVGSYCFTCVVQSEANGAPLTQSAA